MKIIADIINVSMVTVYNNKKALEASDDVSRKPGCGGHNKKRDLVFLGDLKAKINKDLTKSMWKIAAKLNVDPKTIRSAVHDNLGLKSYTRTVKHLLTKSVKARRL